MYTCFYSIFILNDERKLRLKFLKQNIKNVYDGVIIIGRYAKWLSINSGFIILYNDEGTSPHGS